MHYYQFNIGDYASHTARLSPMEDLAYRRMLDLYYLNERPLNGCPTDVAREIGLADFSSDVEYILNKFFQKVDDTFTQKRVDNEIAAYQKKRKQAAKAGRASAKARQQTFNGRSTDVQQDSNDRATNHKPLTINHKPLTTIKDKEDKPKRKRFTAPELHEVTAYMFERTSNETQSASEAARFHDYYTANGWKVGKNKMVDWKATARNWLARNTNQSYQPRLTAAQQTWENIKDLELE